MVRSPFAPFESPQDALEAVKRIEREGCVHVVKTAAAEFDSLLRQNGIVDFELVEKRHFVTFVCQRS